MKTGIMVISGCPMTILMAMIKQQHCSTVQAEILQVSSLAINSPYIR
jgi:hypothetical protein